MKQTGYLQESNILKYMFIPVLLLAFHGTTNYSNEGLVYFTLCSSFGYNKMSIRTE